MKSQATGRRVVSLLGAALCAGLLAACGGADTGPDLSDAQAMQRARETAALERARAANAEAIGRVRGERALRQASSN